jgi:GNAT superfamily N-acetyltransferase
MYDIAQVSIESDHALTLRALLVSEWSDYRAFEVEEYGRAVPEPIVVLFEGNVVGGASFTRFKKPDSEDIATWFNGVFILPEHRKQGIASRVIAFSKGIAPELYALTDIPNLYLKSGWVIEQEDNNGTIVKRFS